MTDNVGRFSDRRAAEAMRRFEQLSPANREATAVVVELLTVIGLLPPAYQPGALQLLQLFSCLQPDHQRRFLELLEDEQLPC